MDIPNTEVNEMVFKIHDNVSIPARRRGTANSAYQVLLGMSDGQCFDVPVYAEEGHKNRSGQAVPAVEWQASAAHARQSYIAGYAKRNGIKIVSRWLPAGDEYSNGAPVIRVWHDGMVVDNVDGEE